MTVGFSFPRTHHVIYRIYIVLSIDPLNSEEIKARN